MNIRFAVAGDETLGSTRLRILNAVPYFEERGFKCTIRSSPSPPDNTLLSRVFFVLRQIGFHLSLLFGSVKGDVLVVQKITFLRPFAWLLSRCYRRVIFDIDDVIYASPEWLDIDDKKRVQAVHPMLTESDVVVAGSPEIREYAEEFASQAYFLQTPFPREKYRLARNEADDDSRSETVTIGWVGYPQNLRYLAIIETELKLLLDRFEHLELSIITASDRPIEPLGNRDDVTYLEWSLDRELEYLSRIDIGVRPLANDTWTRGKSHSSVVQFMALGAPVVVTPIGLLEDLVIEGQNGYHAETSDDWIRWIATLVENPDRRREMGPKAVDSLDEKRLWTDLYAEEYTPILEGDAPESPGEGYSATTIAEE